MRKIIDRVLAVLGMITIFPILIWIAIKSGTSSFKIFKDRVCFGNGSGGSITKGYI